MISGALVSLVLVLVAMIGAMSAFAFVLGIKTFAS